MPIAVWIPIPIVCVVCVIYFWLDYRRRKQDAAIERELDIDIIEWEKAWNRAQWEKEQKEKAVFEAENREQIEQS